MQGNAVQAQVPTVAMKNGNLSASPTAIYDPMTGATSGTGRLPFAGNIIPANRIDPGIAALIATNVWPNPSQAGTGAFGLGQNFLSNGNQGNSGARRDQLDAKVNWNPSAKLSGFVRFGYNNGDWYNPQIFGLLGGPSVSPANISVGVGGANVYNATASATYVFNAHLIVDAYFGYSRIDMYSNQPNQDKNLGSTLLQIPGLSTAGLSPERQLQQGGLPLLSIDGFTILGPANTFQPQDYADPEKNIVANVNWIKGSHNIRAGFEADLQNSSETQYQTSSNGFITSSGGFHFAQGTTQLNADRQVTISMPSPRFCWAFRRIRARSIRLRTAYTTRNQLTPPMCGTAGKSTPKLTVSYGARASITSSSRDAKAPAWNL